MDASHLPSCSESPAKAPRDEDMWDEIVDEDFSDDEHEWSMSASEDNDLVLLPAALQPLPRTVWQILADRLAESSFEAKFVDPAQRRANEAAIKRRYQLDPTKRHTWISKCGRHQVVGYFNVYAQGTVGLFTEEGFPVYVKLHELSLEDVRFVVNKLGFPLRGKVEAQLSANQILKQMEEPKDNSDNQMVHESSVVTKGQVPSEGPKHMAYKRFGEPRERRCNEAAASVPKTGLDVNKGRPGLDPTAKNTKPTCKEQSRLPYHVPSGDAVLKRDAAEWNARWEASPLASTQPGAAQAHASDGPISFHMLKPNRRSGPLSPDDRPDGLGYPHIESQGVRFAHTSINASAGDNPSA